MKLIIDIDEQDYERFKKNYEKNYDESMLKVDVIKNGTPLDMIRAEIYEHFMTIDGKVYDKSAIKCMEIIDKYKAESEE